MSTPVAPPDYTLLKQSVEAFDRAEVESLTHDTVQRSLAETGADRIFADVAGLLGRTLGAWYQHGPAFADETITGFCACHSLQRITERTPPEDRVAALTAATMEQVDTAIAWRRGLIAWIDSQPPAELVTESALVGLVQCIAGLGIGTSWHFHIDVAVMWMIDASGLPPSEELSDMILYIAETHFSSGVRPDGNALSRFAESAAWTIVEARLDQA